MSDVEVGTKRSSDYTDEYGEVSYKKSRNDKEKMRFLMVGRYCGAIIGKGGENIKRLRSDYSVNLNLPDTRSNERVLTLQGDRESCLAVMKDIISACKEAPYAVDPKKKCVFEINFLAQSDQVGAVIGKGGQKIKDIREESNGKVKVYQDCLPNSNERIIAIGGDDESRLLAAFEIVLDVLHDHPKKMQTIYYDPKNKNMDQQNSGGHVGHGGYGGHGGHLGHGGHSQLQMGGNNQLGSLGGLDRGLGGGLGALGGLSGLAAGAATLLGQLGVGAQGGNGILGAAGGVSSLLGNNLNGRDGILGTGDNRGGQSGGYGGEQSTGFGMNRNSGGNFGQFNGGSNSDRDNRNSYQNNDRDRGDFAQMQTVAKVTVSNDMCGAIIGKSGQRIKEIRQSSGARVDFTEAERGSKEDRVITVTGTQHQTIAAQQMMAQCVRNRHV